MIRKVLTISFASACLGAIALVTTPSVGVAADMPKSYKGAKAKKKPAAKSAARAGMPQSKAGPRLHYNPPGSRFPSSWRY
ncbi:MAG: hypothetical protein ACK4MV_21300 [Beijerinckiaceae bacterium]